MLDTVQQMRHLELHNIISQIWGGRGALFAARKRSGRKAASNGSWRSLSFVRFLRSRLKTIFFRLACRASAVITGCVQDASYACKKPHSSLAPLPLRFAAKMRSPVALQAAKSLPALGDGVSGRNERQSRLGAKSNMQSAVTNGAASRAHRILD